MADGGDLSSAAQSVDRSPVFRRNGPTRWRVLRFPVQRETRLREEKKAIRISTYGDRDRAL